MFWIASVLFVVGIYLFGWSVTLPAFQAPVFVLGILLVCLALALPMYAPSSAHQKVEYEER